MSNELDPKPSTEEITPNPTEEQTPPTTEGDPPKEDKSLINSGEEGKTDPPVEVVPLTAEDLKPPEGFELDEELSTKFLDVVNNSELSPADRANALIGLHKEITEAALAKDSEAWDSMQEEWKTAAKADPDVGGVKLQPALTNIAKLMDEYGSDELRGVFDLTGAGNNVHVIKFLNSIAVKLTEGSPIAGLPGEEKGQKTAAQRMYPSMKG